MTNPSIKEIWNDRIKRRAIVHQNDFVSVIKTWLAVPLIKILLFTPITANQVTFLSILSILAGSVLFGIGTNVMLLWGIFCIFLAEIFDHTDGSIARFKKQTSILQSEFLGRFYHICGTAFVHFGLAYGIFRQSGDVIYLYLSFSSAFFHMLTMYLSQLKSVLILYSVRNKRLVELHETNLMKKSSVRALSFVHHLFFDYIREIIFIGILFSFFITSAVLKGIVLAYALLIVAKLFFVFFFVFFKCKELEPYAVPNKKL